VALVTIVEDKIKKTTVREYSCAKEAPVLQNIIDRPCLGSLNEKRCILPKIMM